MTVSIMVDGEVIQVAAGDPRIPLPSPAAVPQSVLRYQGRLALNSAGLLDQVDQAVAAADRATQIWYSDAPVWERHNSILVGLGATLGLTDAQMDALFTQAAAL